MSPHLIRMWERRYSAIQPSRTPTGRRMYTEEDIERLVLLRRATMEGESISQIAQLSEDELRALMPSVDSQPEEGGAYNDEASIDQHLHLCLQSMKEFDAVGLETRLLRASVKLGQRTFLEKLLHPLLETTGEMWSDGRFSVANEHLASAVVRSLLGSMYLSNSSGAGDPLLIGATPQGQHHEFGALMALATAAAGGWRTLYLGPNLPAEDIAQTAMDRGADAIALSIVYRAEEIDLPKELRRVHEITGDGIPLLVGGRSAYAFDEALAEIGAVRVSGLSDLRKELDRLKRQAQGSALNRGSEAK